MANEPGAIELTKEQYENYRSVKQGWPSGKDAEDVSEAVVKDTEAQAVSPFSGTRSEAIKILCERGLEYRDLKSKRKAELVEML